MARERIRTTNFNYKQTTTKKTSTTIDGVSKNANNFLHSMIIRYDWNKSHLFSLSFYLWLFLWLYFSLSLSIYRSPSHPRVSLSLGIYYSMLSVALVHDISLCAPTITLLRWCRYSRCQYTDQRPGTANWVAHTISKLQQCVFDDIRCMAVQHVCARVLRLWSRTWLDFLFHFSNFLDDIDS